MGKGVFFINKVGISNDKGFNLQMSKMSTEDPTLLTAGPPPRFLDSPPSTNHSKSVKTSFFCHCVQKDFVADSVFYLLGIEKNYGQRMELDLFPKLRLYGVLFSWSYTFITRGNFSIHISGELHQVPEEPAF